MSISLVATFCILAVASGSNLTRFDNVVWDNGDLVTGKTTFGADVSEATTNVIGHNANCGLSVSVLDDFELTKETTLSVLDFFVYQTGSTSNSSFTRLSFEILDGNNEFGNVTVAGNLSLNVLNSTAFTGIYRTSDGDLDSSNRPLMLVTAVVDITLPAGYYVLRYCVEGSLASGPWVPFVTPENGGNALQEQFKIVIDELNVELPFVLYESASDSSIKGPTKPKPKPKPKPAPSDSSSKSSDMMLDSYSLSTTPFFAAALSDSDIKLHGKAFSAASDMVDTNSGAADSTTHGLSVLSSMLIGVGCVAALVAVAVTARTARSGDSSPLDDNADEAEDNTPSMHPLTKPMEVELESIPSTGRQADFIL